MIVIGKIDWFGDKKAIREGHDGFYGFVTSLDQNNNGSFKLYKDQIKGNYFNKEDFNEIENPYSDGLDDIFSDALVAFYPNTMGRRSKACSLYHVSDYPDKIELREAFNRVKPGFADYPLILELMKDSDEPVESQISFLSSVVSSNYISDLEGLYPYIIKNDRAVIDHQTALRFLARYGLRSSRGQNVKDVLEALVKAEIGYYLDHFLDLSNAEKTVITQLMPDDFLIRNPHLREYGNASQVKALDDHLERIKRAEISERLKEAAERRGIKYFVHFTNVENLESILTHGILTRQDLDDNAISYSYTDPSRFDCVLNSISLSVTYPNYKMLFKKKLDNPEVKWCVLLIKVNDVLDRPCYFNQTNAASRNACRGNDVYHFERMFDSKVGEYDRQDMVECASSTGCNYATDPQAEVLCCSTIPVESIYGCTFEDMDMLEQYKEMLENAGINAKYFVWNKSKSPYANYKASPIPKEQPAQYDGYSRERFPF